MAMHHCSVNEVGDQIEPRFWLNAESDLVEKVARHLCARHTYEIWGDQKGQDFIDSHWRCFECEARDAIALVRRYDAGNG